MRLNAFPCSSGLLSSFFNPPNVATISTNSIPNCVSNQQLVKNLNPHSEFLQICLQHCWRIQAHNLFDEKPKPVLQALSTAKVIHSKSLKIGVGLKGLLGNVIVDLYVKCGNVDFAQKAFSRLEKKDVFAWNSVLSMLADARKLFTQIPNPNVVAWNVMISGHAKRGFAEEAISFFLELKKTGLKATRSSLGSVLSAIASLSMLNYGSMVHAQATKEGLDDNVYVGSALVNMYAKCSKMDAAKQVFNSLGLLDGCDGAFMLNLGRQIHGQVMKWGFLSSSEMVCVSLLCLYMNSQRFVDSETLFSELQYPKGLVVWTALISGYAQQNHHEKALQFYQHMRSDNILPDQAAFASVLRACAGMSSLQNGQEIHSLIFHTGFNMDEVTCSSLIDMYAKCGDVKGSLQVFREMPRRNNVISWNSMIVGLAKNGYAEEALEIFKQMEQQSIIPDEVTFLGVLSACSHAGRVSEGRKVFDLMVNNYKLLPRVDHLGCMVDILGRWGFLNEAEEFINKLGCKADPMLWSTLLGACRKHGDEVRGKRAADKLMELKPQSSSSYVLLSSIYAESENWSGAVSLRREMKLKGVKKLPGYSWIEPGRDSSCTIQEPANA
ncbi:hypothetical protein Csa_016808 [Cucumis sativus]|nr:hypothetical protein Csa_016808 [Cucumis sativus]